MPPLHTALYCHRQSNNHLQVQPTQHGDHCTRLYMSFTMYRYMSTPLSGDLLMHLLHAHIYKYHNTSLYFTTPRWMTIYHYITQTTNQMAMAAMDQGPLYPCITSQSYDQTSVTVGMSSQFDRTFGCFWYRHWSIPPVMFLNAGYQPQNWPSLRSMN